MACALLRASFHLHEGLRFIVTDVTPLTFLQYQLLITASFNELIYDYDLAYTQVMQYGQ